MIFILVVIANAAYLRAHSYMFMCLLAVSRNIRVELPTSKYHHVPLSLCLCGDEGLDLQSRVCCVKSGCVISDLSR